MKSHEPIFRAATAGALAFLTLAGCGDAGHSHGEQGAHHDHGGGSHGDHGEGDHGHGETDRPAHVVTQVGEHAELFVEFPAFVAGRASPFAAHFTELDDYQPVRNGRVSIVLTSQDAPGERWEANEPARPGIFTPAVTPKHVAKRRLIVLLETDKYTERFDLGEYEIAGSTEEAAELDIDNPEGEISFLKEQQWKVDFDVAAVVERSIRPSVAANATLRPSSDGEAFVAAPLSGRIAAPVQGVPQVGQPVEAGDVVAKLVPNLGAGDVAQLRSELRKAEVEAERAKRELERVTRLVETGAIPDKRLQDATSQRELARAEVERARARLGQYRTMESRAGGSRGAVAIRSPIDGTIAERSAIDGGFVSSGERLFHIVDRSQLWLEAHVAEADLPGLEEPTGAWFRPSRKAAPIVIEAGKSGELISFGGIIDAKTRSAPLIFGLADAAELADLRVGSFVRAHIFSGPARQAVAIPTSAVLDEKGLDVVFVMKGGESYERRNVRLGVRDRGFVEVLDGLEPGERVVSKGAYYVKLASTRTDDVGHGHAH